MQSSALIRFDNPQDWFLHFRYKLRGETLLIAGQVNTNALGKTAAVAAPSRSAIELTPSTVFAMTMLAAVALYFFRLGGASLGASEAYSAWAAAMPSASSIIRIPVLLDPGKQVFYYILLHYFTGVFGFSETSVRMLSAISAVATLAILFSLGRSMFTDPVAASACVLWAFNPVIMILSRRARMYPMFAVIALTHFMLLWQVRRRPDRPRTIICGIFGALTIYTHLAGLFLIGAEAAMLLRDTVRGRMQRQPWIALGIALLLFIPYVPIFTSQSHALVYGHWLDWIGAGYHFNLAEKVLTALIAAAIGIYVVFGPAREENADEPIRWCIAWGVLPLIAFLAGSIVVRPMFHIRYLIPCVAMIALVVARMLEALGSKTRNLAVVAITATLLVLVPVKEITHEPWREIAQRIGADSSQQPVFFESGFLFFGQSAGVENGGFPTGYYRVPFDYYFRARNPEVAVPGWDPTSARNTITEAVSRSGGGWLVSWKADRDARDEMPLSNDFRIVQEVNYPLIALYRIESAPPSKP